MNTATMIEIFGYIGSVLVVVSMLMSSVVKLSPKKVVYVSCGPDTLARDLKYFTSHGYKVKECTPFDCFPMTEHIESVCLLSKVNNRD